MLQLAIMNHMLIMLDDEVQARQRCRVNDGFSVYHWISADRRLQLGHYDQLSRELRMEDSTSFFNNMRMEPLMFDKIFNRVSPRIQKNDTIFRRALGQDLKLARTPRK